MFEGRRLDLTGYRLTFDDEFNRFVSNGPSNYQDRSHTGTWDTTYAYGERRLNDEVERYSDPTIGVDPFSVQHGVLSIHAAPSTDPLHSWSESYTSGVITTNHSFAQRYGYFEMRAELPRGEGMWPAFWMLPLVHVWPPELDIMEAFGATNANGEGGARIFHHGNLAPGAPGAGGWQDTPQANLYAQYNTFGVDWQPDRLTYYFNGEAYDSQATPAGFDQPMYLLANLAVGGAWPGAPAGETADLKIDYIRAFSQDGTNPVIAQDVISSPDGRGHDFYGATDADGRPAAGGPDGPPPPPVLEPAPPAAPIGDQVAGSGTHDLMLLMSEDAFQGDARFLVTVDGVRVGGAMSTSAARSAHASQAFHILGDFAPGVHRASVFFLNNVAGGAGTDRNLFLDAASIDGATIQGGRFDAYFGGEQSFAFIVGDPAALRVSPSATRLGDGPDTVTLFVSEDAYQGDAEFTVSVDGVRVGGVQTATALRVAGGRQEFDVRGSFGAGPHRVELDFINDFYGGAAWSDRNLYVEAASYRGSDPAAVHLDLQRGGIAGFDVGSVAPASTPVSQTGPFVDLSGVSVRGSVFSAVGGVVMRSHDGVSESYAGVREMRFLDGRMVFDPDDPAAQVTRLYGAALGRAPDQDGLNAWVARLQAGTPLTALSSAFLGSPEFADRFGVPGDAGYAALLYRHVLGRDGDPEGTTHWMGKLQAGTGRDDVLAAFSESAENRGGTEAVIAVGIWDRDEAAGQVARLYKAALGRLPDASGLAYWRGVVDGGTIGAANVAAAFLGSPEFAARYGGLADRDFIQALYQNTLGRAGEDEGASYWTAQIRLGALSRAGVVAGFAESPEHIARTTPLFTSNDPAEYGISLAV